MSANFNERRRQPYIGEDTFNNMIAFFKSDRTFSTEKMLQYKDSPYERTGMLEMMASSLWSEFQFRFTTGTDCAECAAFLTTVVEGYERAVESGHDVSNENYYPVFMIDDPMDEYVDYLNMLSAAVLLHRDDLIPRIYALLEGTDYDGIDLVIEELLDFYLPDRPFLDELLWGKPYQMLVEAIDSESPAEKAKAMRKYVSKWYPSMKGQAHFWGKHEKITPKFSPYFGYWAMCAGAFTYLYDIDDSSYRDEIVYPKDMVDYARSMPRRPVKLEDGRQMLRIVGGQACPQEGKWFSPAKADSLRHFRVGEIMPSFDASEYGLTIWQWSAGA